MLCDERGSFICYGSRELIRNPNERNKTGGKKVHRNAMGVEATELTMPKQQGPECL
jgi:hypothetical protein